MKKLKRLTIKVKQFKSGCAALEINRPIETRAEEKRYLKVLNKIPVK